MNRRTFLRGLFQVAGLAIATSYSRLGAVIEPDIEEEPGFAYFESAPRLEFWKRDELIPGTTPTYEVIADYNDRLERFRKFKDTKGVPLFDDQAAGEHLVWCARSDRQAFIDAGIPEGQLVHSGGLHPEFAAAYRRSRKR